MISEVHRLEELKLQNIRSVIDAIRSEMAVLWERCFFSAEQRQAFAPYFRGGFEASATVQRPSHIPHRSLTFVFFLSSTEDFTEELLALHDAEIQQLKEHHEKHRELFDGVQRWEESWRLLQELEVSDGWKTFKTFRRSNFSRPQPGVVSAFCRLFPKVCRQSFPFTAATEEPFKNCLLVFTEKGHRSGEIHQ